MDAAIFKVRTQTKKDVQSDVEGLTLSKNDGGSYTHEDAQVFKNGVSPRNSRQPILQRRRRQQRHGKPSGQPRHGRKRTHRNETLGHGNATGDTREVEGDSSVRVDGEQYKAITHPILRTADSTTLKHVNQFHLHELMKAVVKGADRPTTGDIRGKYGAIYRRHQLLLTKQNGDVRRTPQCKNQEDQHVRHQNS